MFGYYVNDLTRTITNNSTTRTFGLDPSGRYNAVTSAGVTTFNHYRSDMDTPAWTTSNSSGTDWVRYVSGSSALQATVIRVSGVDTVKLQIHNLHGDIITTADPGDTTLNDPAQETTEYGLPRDGTNTRYDYLGAHQRHNDTQSGITLMGVRNYNPASGRFASADAVLGGSSNSYDYVSGDPVGSADTSGLWKWGIKTPTTVGGCGHLHVHHTYIGLNYPNTDFKTDVELWWCWSPSTKTVKLRTSRDPNYRVYISYKAWFWHARDPWHEWYFYNYANAGPRSGLRFNAKQGADFCPPLPPFGLTVCIDSHVTKINVQVHYDGTWTFGCYDDANCFVDKRR